MDKKEIKEALHELAETLGDNDSVKQVKIAITLEKPRTSKAKSEDG